MSVKYRTDQAPDGTQIVASYLPHDSWGVDLVAAVMTAFGRAPGSHFVADLLKVDKLFPVEWDVHQRRERMNRLFERPLQADDLLFAIESSPGRMYQKVRKLVARHGRLTDADVLRTPQNRDSMVRSLPTRANVLALPDDASAPRDDGVRISQDALASIAAHEHRLEAIESEMLSNGMTLGGQKFLASEERIALVRRRMTMISMNLANLADAVRKLHPDLVYVAHKELRGPDGVVDIEPEEEK